MNSNSSNNRRGGSNHHHHNNTGNRQHHRNNIDDDGGNNQHLHNNNNKSQHHRTTTNNSNQHHQQQQQKQDSAVAQKTSSSSSSSSSSSFPPRRNYRNTSRGQRRHYAPKKHHFSPNNSPPTEVRDSSNCDGVDEKSPNSKAVGLRFGERNAIDSVAEVGCSSSGLGSLSLSERADVNAVVEEEEEEAVDNELKRVLELEGEGSGDGDDVFTRLEALRFRGDVEELDLSEEQMTTNDQLQEDELLAMESIYGDNAFILDRKDGLRSFQVCIHPETPAELTITAKVGLSDNLKMKTDISDEFSYSFKIEHLPPITLTCLFPKSYPSHQPPYFTISTVWLDATRISKLCCMLDAMWMPEQEVIYQWVEWLQNSALSYLGVDDEIMLGPYGTEDAADDRAVSRSVSLDVDIPKLRSYNDEKCVENFLNSVHDCCICYSEYAGGEFVRLPCMHFFCWKCMKTYSGILVAEGSVNKLLCPDEKCGGMVPPNILKQLLGDEEYERWESLMLQKTLASMSDVTLCPRCETHCIEDPDHHGQCPKCYFSFCTLCMERWHVGGECLTPEMKLKILEERQHRSQLNDQQRRKEQEMINELISIKVIQQDAKQCPNCRIAISKTEGCNKMVCRNCEQFFCYKCGKAIDGYDHFKGGTCELFPDVMVQAWNAQVNERQIIAQVMADLRPDQANACPNCGQVNAKSGKNNHILCWACQMHYCFLCRKVIRRGTIHFGRKGCKQHTDD